MRFADGLSSCCGYSNAVFHGQVAVFIFQTFLRNFIMIVRVLRNAVVLSFSYNSRVELTG